MKASKVLVTGGSGFIGSHVIELLHRNHYDLIVLDNMDPQVHGTQGKPTGVRDMAISYVIDDIRNRKKLGPILKKVDAVIHLAACVGVGQSMYEIERYVDSNTRGTATLLELLAS